MTKVVSRPCNQDILFGKGGRSNHHEGNKRYNKLIQANKLRYFLLTSNEDKGLFLKAIQIKLCDDEGRKFVELNEDTEEWQEVTTQRIREKIRTALCDAKLKNALEIGPKVFWPGSTKVDPFEEESSFTSDFFMEDLSTCQSLTNDDTTSSDVPEADDEVGSLASLAC